MLIPNDSYCEIIELLQHALQEKKHHFSDKMNRVVFEAILEVMESVKNDIYVSTEHPEYFTKASNEILLKNFSPYEKDFFIGFNTYYHDYIGTTPYRHNIPSAFLKITSNTNAFSKINTLLNRDDEKDLIIPFYKIDENWSIPVYAFSYDMKKATVLSLFPIQKQKMELEKDDDKIHQERSYFVHYLLETYKKIIFINFNKNVDYLHIKSPSDRNIDYLIPHIFLKQEKTVNEEQWLAYHKYDKEKLHYLRTLAQSGHFLDFE